MTVAFKPDVPQFDRTNTPDIAKGEAITLVRAIENARDPLALYAALSEGGARPDTMLFEQAAGPALLLDRAAVRAECRGREVVVSALTPNGQVVLARLDERFADRSIGREPDRLTLRFPAPHSLDAGERLAEPSPLDVIRALTTMFKQRDASEPFGLICLGTLAYDHVELFESLPEAAEDILDYPNFLFWLAEALVLFPPDAPPHAVSTSFSPDEDDAAARLGALVARCEAAPRAELAAPSPAEPDFSQVDLDDDAYGEVVTAMKTEIAAGEVYQIVPSRTFRAPCPAPLRAFASVRAFDRSPFTFFVASHAHRLFGASPEVSVRIFDAGQRKVEVKPIAGTRRRGANADEDDRLEAELRLDGKELAEHMMLVDLARNDIARISRPGTRRVARLMDTERYARVMHLVSSVVGTLKDGLDAIDALKACLNVGTLTGAPKISATQLLRQVEKTRRGPYGGAVGWINGAGLMESAVIIRSAVVRDGIAFVRAGAGVVHDSDPAAEAEETKRKASALLSALAGAAS